MDGEPFEERVGLADHLDDLLLRIEHRAARARPLAVAAVVVAVAAVVGWWAWRGLSARPPVEDRIPLAAPVDATATPTGDAAPASPAPGSGAGPAGDPSSTGGAGDEEGRPSAEVVVHVVGAVRRPGLVTLPEGARISDAVEAAGGALPTGEPDRLNLASPLVDGMQIRVPTSDPDSGADGPDGGDEVLVRLPEAGPDPGGGSGGPVDLNRASAAELESLPGIGPTLAGAIVDWRAERGAFAAVEDLQDVPGIGPAKLAALRDLVAV